MPLSKALVFPLQLALPHVVGNAEFLVKLSLSQLPGRLVPRSKVDWTHKAAQLRGIFLGRFILGRIRDYGAAPPLRATRGFRGGNTLLYRISHELDHAAIEHHLAKSIRAVISHTVLPSPVSNTLFSAERGG